MEINWHRYPIVVVSRGKKSIFLFKEEFLEKIHQMDFKIKWTRIDSVHLPQMNQGINQPKNSNNECGKGKSNVENIFET